MVSARKYRPKGFEEVVGQSHITTTLTNAIKNNQLAQALLFCGPRGIGKTTCARIVARMINGFEEGESNTLNIFELDAASNNSVDDIRSLIDQVRYPPQQGNYKVYIIDEVHMLSTAAFNAFLKTLEEPPSYAIFILATTEKHKVIPTILSRCQIFDFNRIQVSDISSHLKKIADAEGIKAEAEALHLIAQKADGALRDALSIFDLLVTFSSDNEITYQSTIDNLHILDYDYYFRLTDAFSQGSTTEPLLIFDEILQKGFDGHNFVVGLNEHFRNLLLSKFSETLSLMDIPDSAKTRFAEQSAGLDESWILSAMNITNQCDLNYKTSKNQRMLVELALLKLSHLTDVLELKAPELSEEKKKTPELAREVQETKPEESEDKSSPPELTEPPKSEEPAPVKEDVVEDVPKVEEETAAETPQIPLVDVEPNVSKPDPVKSEEQIPSVKNLPGPYESY